MSKVKVLRSGNGVSVELGSYYKWWEINLADGSLTTSVCLDGTALREPITPKQLRKIAKTLLKLADEVDPPAPKFEYFRFWTHYHAAVFFYRTDGDGFEVFDDDENTWGASFISDTLEGLKSFWTGYQFSETTADELPEGAR